MRRISHSYDFSLFPSIRHMLCVNTSVEYYERKSQQKTGMDAYDCLDKCNSLNKILNCSLLNQYTFDLPVSSLCPVTFKSRDIS